MNGTEFARQFHVLLPKCCSQRARGRFGQSHHEIGQPLGGIGDRRAARGLRPPLQDCHVCGQPRSNAAASHCGEKSACLHDLRGPDGGKMRGIGRLILIERMGKRHENRRPADRPRVPRRSRRRRARRRDGRRPCAAGRSAKKGATSAMTPQARDRRRGRVPRLRRAPAGR